MLAYIKPTPPLLYFTYVSILSFIIGGYQYFSKISLVGTNTSKAGEIDVMIGSD